MATTQQTNDFTILGPTMAASDTVLNAIYSLYFLPDNYKLILTGSKDTDQSFYNKVVTLVKSHDLAHRVAFKENVDNPSAIILPNAGKSRSRYTISGDSPEALASAILHISRA
jgi:hypothetical protein